MTKWLQVSHSCFLASLMCFLLCLCRRKADIYFLFLILLLIPRGEVRSHKSSLKKKKKRRQRPKQPMKTLFSFGISGKWSRNCEHHLSAIDRIPVDSMQKTDSYDNQHFEVNTNAVIVFDSFWPASVLPVCLLPFLISLRVGGLTESWALQLEYLFECRDAALFIKTCLIHIIKFHPPFIECDHSLHLSALSPCEQSHWTMVA